MSSSEQGNQEFDRRVIWRTFGEVALVFAIAAAGIFAFRANSQGAAAPVKTTVQTFTPASVLKGSAVAQLGFTAAADYLAIESVAVNKSQPGMLTVTFDHYSNYPDTQAATGSQSTVGPWIVQGLNVQTVTCADPESGPPLQQAYACVQGSGYAAYGLATQ